jgi:hypothetical protein
MWSYYGSKGKVVNYYPEPKHDLIIEPFAGAAKYSLKYFERDVLLVDKYDVVVGLWDFLINASKQDILGLPELAAGQSVDDFTLSQEEKYLVGFVIKGGVNSPRKTYSGVGGFGKNQKGQYKRIADQLYKVRHWKVIKGCYADIPNQDATWFIDPPYQYGGNHYKHSNKAIDFPALAAWSNGRSGQVIVCENTKADWMDFKPLVEMQGSKFRTTEAVWLNSNA